MKNSFRYLYFPIILWISVTLTIAIFVAYIDNIYVAGKFFFLFLFVLGVFFIFPSLILYLNYRKSNKGTELNVMRNEKGINVFLYRSQNEEISFTEIEILECKAILSPPIYDRRIPFAFWDEYYYYIICLENRKIYITCLICNDLEKYVQENKIIKNKDYFPLIPRH